MRTLIVACVCGLAAAAAAAEPALPPAVSSSTQGPVLPARHGSAARNLLSPGIGPLVPLGGVDFHSIGGGDASNGDLGALIGLQYLRLLTPRLSAGLDVDYMSRSGTLSERLLPIAASSVFGDTWLALAVVRCSLRERGAARPFFLLGAGGHRTSTLIDARPHVGSAWADSQTRETRRLVDDGVWGPAASVRVGLDFVNDDGSPGIITFEAGWTGLASGHYDATPQGQSLGLSGVSGPINLFSVAARYGWSF